MDAILNMSRRKYTAMWVNQFSLSDNVTESLLRQNDRYLESVESIQVTAQWCDNFCTKVGVPLLVNVTTTVPV